MKDLQKKEGILKLFLSGFALRLKASIFKDVNSQIREQMEGISDKIFHFVSLAFKGLFFKIKLTDEDTYNVIVEFLKNMDIDMPDAADLVDSIGQYISEKTNFFNNYDEIPFIRDLFDNIKNYGKSDIEFGYIDKNLLFSGNLKTEGFEKLFSLLLEGLEE